jgi:hypothetical protein
MENYKKKIDKQFEFNQGKNLFYNGILSGLRFSSDTLEAIEKIDKIDKDAEKLLIDYLTHRALQEFCKMNQYYAFDKSARDSLRNLYVDLFTTIKLHNDSIDSIAEKHYDRLVKWLSETNSFAENIYASKGENIESVACSEYSAELQLEILQMDLKNIVEPVLDIGCGKQGNLVVYLRQQGIDAFGFDRFAYTSPFLAHSDWFEYTFKKNSWGTITSNLGFSNHFHHHHSRKGGNFVGYAQKYMDILGSLRTGGSFHYAPDLPFVEQYLDQKKYQLEKCSIGDFAFQSTRLKRLM